MVETHLFNELVNERMSNSTNKGKERSIRMESKGWEKEKERVEGECRTKEETGALP